jgi:isopenicillin N synthase-like dioxygenase
MTVDFTSIPVIDLGKAQDPATKPLVLEELRHVLLNVGFLYIRNHGVSEEVIQDLVTALPALFALNEQEKNEVALYNSPHFLGYSGAGSETTAGKTDGREQFEFATELTDDWVEGQPLAERLKGPNQARCITSIIRSQIQY